jgi:hypothetical protein
MTGARTCNLRFIWIGNSGRRTSLPIKLDRMAIKRRVDDIGPAGAAQEAAR